MQFSNKFSAGALLSVLSFFTSAAQAQTYSSCNPLSATCPANPAAPAVLDTNFAGASGLPSGWSMAAGSLSYDSNGANFVIAQRGQSQTLQTSGYFLFGYAEVKMKAAAGTGIVTSIVLESDDADEVDWELIGGDNAHVQTNYFGKGDTSTYDRSITFPIANPQGMWHTYAVNWTSSQLTWLIDGVAVRSLNYADAKGGSRYPQTPMRLKLGIWAGGDPSLPEGTITWAGGKTDFSQAPFTMSVASVKLVNYAPATSYVYGDNSGSWQSIKIVGGSIDSSANAGSGSGNSNSGSAITTSSPASTTISKSSTTLVTVVASSNSDVFQVSTASTKISSSTAGGVTTSAPPVIPLNSIIATSTQSSNQTLSRTTAPTSAVTQTTNASNKGAFVPVGLLALSGLGSLLFL